MAEKRKEQGQMVFGLDIGTRSVVGTVGYKVGDVFHVAAQYVKEHETRAMMDGQIHDIEKVANTIAEVREALEAELDMELQEVCIAAAGRVLKTVTSNASVTFSEDTIVDSEHVYAMEMAGVEKAYEAFQKENDPNVKFYCVGYTVVRYYLNDYQMTSLEKHKARKIGVDLIATFLPDEVVDGLYRSVQLSGLEVANLTLEPIAAMQAAVPVMYRMLNIALVDVGAGTSDISITKDGSIVAYGMIPHAGDEFTDTIAQNYLVDFNEAERIKKASGEMAQICYHDILGNQYQLMPDQVLEVVEDILRRTTQEISEKIVELNGGKPVSAVFVVGGGGKLKGFIDRLAKDLGIAEERVALRGSEVLREVDIQFEQAKTDSLFVTPIGICLNFYEQQNNFIFVTFNDKRIKLYDNGRLTVADAALQFGFPNDGLFPKRGKELNFRVNGKVYMVQGDFGEPAVITVNQDEVSMNSLIKAGDQIVVSESTPGKAAELEIRQLREFGATISVSVNETGVLLPKFALVNGALQSEFYAIEENDVIEICNYYTVRQIADFMDVILDREFNLYVNNKRATPDTKVYDNFSVIWSTEELSLSDVEYDAAVAGSLAEEDASATDARAALNAAGQEEDNAVAEEVLATDAGADVSHEMKEGAAKGGLDVIVNSAVVHMSGKEHFIFVDAFDYIEFDLSKPQGKNVVTLLNGAPAQFTAQLETGDRLDIYWEQ